MVNPVMYLILNRGLGMSTGKTAAQAAHAAVEAYRRTPADSNLLRLWYKGGHYAKITLLGRNTEHMYNIGVYLSERDIEFAPIIDEGRTEIDALSFTAIGVPLVDKNDPHIVATFSSFELYKDEVAFDLNALPKITIKEVPPRSCGRRFWKVG